MKGIVAGVHERGLTSGESLQPTDSCSPATSVSPLYYHLELHVSFWEPS